MRLFSSDSLPIYACAAFKMALNVALGRMTFCTKSSEGL
jgi:hypothetical protein